MKGKKKGKSKGSAGAKSGGKAARTPRGRGTAAAEPGDLDDARRRINSLDVELVKLLNARAALVMEVGRLKRAAGLPTYAPHRESEVIDRAIRTSHELGGVLPDKAVEAVYRELMSGSFALQQPLRIGYLGPPGSYSHWAAVKHFGSSVEFEDLRAIDGVFTEVERGHVNYGLAPIENSLHGGIMETLDAFRSRRSAVTIYAEVQMEVHHSLLANCAPAEVRRIHSKPEVFSQCRIWLATQYPQAELIASASSSRAAQTAAEECRESESRGEAPNSAAIASELSGQLYGLNALFVNIEDQPNNITRFLVISRQKAQRSGDDKTSIMFDTADKPGALVGVLHVFERHGVNLSHIDKRPSGRTNWTYTFFIDAAGHWEDAKLAGAIAEARTHCKDLVVLGSYPRSKRIL